MRSSIGDVPALIDVELRFVDLSGGERQDGLLLRLKNQNSALEKLRHALDGDDDEPYDAAMLAAGNAA